jgi:hypothetical protein
MFSIKFIDERAFSWHSVFRQVQPRIISTQCNRVSQENSSTDYFHFDHFARVSIIIGASCTVHHSPKAAEQQTLELLYLLSWCILCLHELKPSSPPKKQVRLLMMRLCCQSRPLCSLVVKPAHAAAAAAARRIGIAPKASAAATCGIATVATGALDTDCCLYPVKQVVSSVDLAPCLKFKCASCCVAHSNVSSSSIAVPYYGSASHCIALHCIANSSANDNGINCTL